MSPDAILAVSVALAVMVTIAAHLLDQIGEASAISRVGLRLAAVAYVAFVVFSLFAGELR